MTEAIDVVIAELSDEVDSALAQAETFPEAIGVIVAPWRRLLVDHDFALGCPMAATIVDAADNDDLRVHVNELLTQWQASVADLYVKFGDPPSVADEQSTMLLAAIEGALILARARRSTEPLDTVQRYFAARPPKRATRQA
jgi:TetR/AcrR family transcriptional repressor of lmrAB and yxaGH operons